MRTDYNNNVVIFGNETQGLGILRFLKKTQCCRFLFDKDSAGIAKYSDISNIYYKTPEYSEHKLLLDFFLRIAEENNFKDVKVLATDDEQVKFLSKYKGDLSVFYKINYPDWSMLSKIFYKIELYKFASDEGIPVPDRIILNSINDLKENEINYPVIVKPSEKEKFLKRYKKKAIECKNELELKMIFKECEEIGIRSSELIIQKIIEGDGCSQFSLVGFFNNSEYLYKRTALRIRQHPIDYGKASTYVELVKDNEIIEDYSMRILKSIDYSGPFETEFKYDNFTKKYYLLDVNLRFWGWHSILEDEINIPEIVMQNYYETKTGFNKKENRSWINIVTDIPVALQLIFKGKLKLITFIRQVFKSSHAVFSLQDPLPFLMQLLLIPYLIFKRGY